MKLRSLLALGCALTSSAALADNWSFANVSLNYLDWSQGTQDRSGKKDFGYVEFEGGMGGNWGDVYGFLDIENPMNDARETDPRDNRRYAGKVVGRYNLTSVAGAPVQLYAHVYDAREHNGFFTQNRVLGLGTSLTFGSLTIKPFAGAHNQLDSFGVGSGRNGYMVGYTLLYPFQLFGQSMMASQWHETELAREDKFTGAYKSKTGNNGAVALWWTPTKLFTAGIQYRYADQKLGSSGYQNAIIYTTKYNF